jgi:hypothetical protein
MHDYQVTMFVTLRQTVYVAAEDEGDAAFAAEDQLDCHWSEVEDVHVVEVQQQRSRPAAPR